MHASSSLYWLFKLLQILVANDYTDNNAKLARNVCLIYKNFAKITLQAGGSHPTISIYILLCMTV